MNIGVIKETKPQEYRVSVLPIGVKQLTAGGHTVTVEAGAGAAAGYTDKDYLAAGARIAERPDEVYDRADLLMKVKEPVPDEFDRFKTGQGLFCYIHSETRPALVDMLLEKRITAIAFENIRLTDGSFPLLAPMSVIAGQQAILQGMMFLCNHRGGIGKSLVAYPGLERPKVVVLGAGPAGSSAARVAAALGCEVSLFELRLDRIERISLELPPNVKVLHSLSVDLEPFLRDAHMVVNAATVPPDSPTHLIDRKMLKKMKKGSVIVDVTANLKGAVETIDRYTTHGDPVFVVDDVVHYAVTNIPGTVAQTASQALAMAVLPYLSEIANLGMIGALEADPALLAGLTTIDGTLCWRQSGTYQNRIWSTPEEALLRVSKQ